MKDDAPTRPLAHVKYVREKTRKQNECESVGSDVTGVFRGFSRLCFSYLLRACVRVVCVCVCVCVVVALCTELYLRIEFLLFSPFLPPSADHPALAPVDCCWGFLSSFSRRSRYCEALLPILFCFVLFCLATPLLFSVCQTWISTPFPLLRFCMIFQRDLIPKNCFHFFFFFFWSSV